nr:sigma-70 family RNA polymerase sigma factor [Variovorax boronicumulans]
MYVDHRGWLLGWLSRRLGNAWDAADVLHDTFARLIGSGRLPDQDQSRAFLTQIAKGLVIDLHRRRQLEAAYLDALGALPAGSAPSPELRAELLQALLAIDAALNKLPAGVRTTFLLSQIDGLTYSDIAERQGLSVGAVRKHMLKALVACHAALDNAA